MQFIFIKKGAAWSNIEGFGILISVFLIVSCVENFLCNGALFRVDTNVTY